VEVVMKVARSLFLVLVAALGLSVILPARADVLVYDHLGNISIPGVSSPLPPTITLGPGNYVATVESVGHPPFFDYLRADFFGKVDSQLSTLLGSAFSAGTPPATNLPFSLGAVTQILPLLVAFPGEVVPGFRSSNYEVTITEKITPVPEPTAWLMITGGLGLLGWLRLRKSANIG
jgi:hypothetical protein